MHLKKQKKIKTSSTLCFSIEMVSKCLTFGCQVVLGLAVWIEEVTCLPLYAMLHFTGELEKQPVCLFSDPSL